MNVLAWRPAALAVLAFVSVLPSACVMRRDGPDFKIFSSKSELPMSHAPQRVDGLELQVVTSEYHETHTALGKESCTAYLDVKVTNHTQKPLAVVKDSALAKRGAEGPTAVYMNSKTLPPGGSDQLKLAIPCGYGKNKRPTELFLDERRFVLR